MEMLGASPRGENSANAQQSRNSLAVDILNSHATTTLFRFEWTALKDTHMHVATSSGWRLFLGLTLVV